MTYATRSWTQWLSVHVDRLAIGLSGLCVVHCLASAVLLALRASDGGILPNLTYHEVGLSRAIGLGVIAQGRGERTRVVSGKRVSVRVDLGGRRTIKKNKDKSREQ